MYLNFSNGCMLKGLETYGFGLKGPCLGLETDLSLGLKGPGLGLGLEGPGPGLEH